MLQSCLQSGADVHPMEHLIPIRGKHPLRQARGDSRLNTHHSRLITQKSRKRSVWWLMAHHSKNLPRKAMGWVTKNGHVHSWVMSVESSRWPIPCFTVCSFFECWVLSRYADAWLTGGENRALECSPVLLSRMSKNNFIVQISSHRVLALDKTDAPRYWLELVLKLFSVYETRE